MGKWETLSNPITLEAHSARHQDTGADEISIEGLAGTSLAMNAHSAAVTGIHGAGRGTIAVIADITTHAALTIVHSLGSMAQAASADYASTTVYASHTASNAVHGAGTVASLLDVTTHATASSGIHGSGTAALATTSQITTHAGLTATHCVAGTIAAKADITDTVIVLADITTNDVTSTKHGFAPKSPANTGLFLNGGATPAWAAPPGGTGILSTTYKAGTQSFSSTTLVNVTGMTFACASTTLYHYKFISMHKSGTATVGVKYSVTYPSSTIAAGKVDSINLASVTTAAMHGLISTSGTAITGTSVVAANTICIAVIEGIVRATNAGSIQLQACAEAAGTIWIMDGSVGLLYTII